MAILMKWPENHYLLSLNLQHVVTEIVCCSYLSLPDELITLLIVTTFFQHVKYLKLDKDEDNE